MVSWWWIIFALCVGAFLGIMASAILAASGRNDDWEEGYWAGRGENKA